MSNTAFNRTDCRMCSSLNLETVVELAPTPIGSHYVPENQLTVTQERYPVDLSLCRDCGYVALTHVVNVDDIYSDRAETTSMSLGVVEHLRRYARNVLDNIKPESGSLVIDIGSNDGTLLKFFQQSGMKVLGVDPCDYIAEIANEAGVPTLSTYFTAEVAETIKKEYGPAKIILANRVFANVDNLSGFIAGVRTLLAHDGDFFFETGYLVDILENLLFDTIYHEHMGYDLVKPLAAFFPNHGMQLVDIERNQIKGGSIRGKVRHAEGPNSMVPKVSDLIAMEESIDLHHPTGYKTFNDSLHKGKHELKELIADIKGKGQTVAGFGASVGSTTEIYYFDLGGDLDFLVDDDPRNQQLFSPGHHIPVYAPQALYDLKPDYVLILAWRYTDAIIKNHQTYLDEGRHFIIPLPSLKII